jgi:hypothetical protein
MCGDRDPSCAKRPLVWDSGPRMLARDPVAGSDSLTIGVRLRIPSPRVRALFSLWVEDQARNANASTTTTVTVSIYPVRLLSNGQRQRMPALDGANAEALTAGKGFEWEFASGVRDYDVDVAIPLSAMFGDPNQFVLCALEAQPDGPMSDAAWEELYDLIALEVPSQIAVPNYSGG